MHKIHKKSLTSEIIIENILEISLEIKEKISFETKMSKF